MLYLLTKFLFTFTFLIAQSNITVLGSLGDFRNLLNDVNKRDESLENNILQELGEKDEYIHIPVRNMRQIRIRNLQNLEIKLRQEEITLHKMEIEAKEEESQDFDEIKKLEHQLLSRELWAFCEWVKDMPPPFDTDKQCSKTELEFLLDNTSSMDNLLV